MPTDAYRDLLNQIQRLTLDEQFQLLEDLVALVRRQATTKQLHSIMELQGLGKEIWEGVDVDKYIEEERNSWDREL